MLILDMGTLERIDQNDENYVRLDMSGAATSEECRSEPRSDCSFVRELLTQVDAQKEAIEALERKCREYETCEVCKAAHNSIRDSRIVLVTHRCAFCAGVKA